ncbi:hypothetical protein P5673_012594 [Acropora cervicornis]|uniref:Uncharacterized protein n=1 Tax=Acropora cervicornis TaxID=6130 RepID=A0AAD9V7Y7_ACRCE|nr:hypothetical protein P5673_012594 [Acropora cervicornis]
MWPEDFWEDYSNMAAAKRFEKVNIPRLKNALQLPGYYICRNGTCATAMEALLILLRRLAYPNRWCELVSLFGRAESELSIIDNRYSHLRDSLDLIWLDTGLFSELIHGKGASLQQCWGFINGTARPLARPIHSQRIMFNGHKRTHCI